MTKKELAGIQRRIAQGKLEMRARDKAILSKPGLKLFKFIIGPYQLLEDERGIPWLHLFVVARSKAEAIRLKKAQDKTCDPAMSIRARRHKWHLIPFNVGEVVLA